MSLFAPVCFYLLFTDDCSFPKGRKIVIVGGVAGGGSTATRYFR